MTDEHAQLDVSFVLATVNEAKSLPVLLPSIEEECSRAHEILVVDDGSTDGTREYLVRWSSSHSNLRAILNPNRQSTLRAHYQGLHAARGSLIVVMDSDLQHPASTIASILDQLDHGFDLVVASRYLAGGSTGDRSPVRGLISRVAALLARIAIPQARRLTDPLSGYIGVRREVVPELDRVHRGFKILLFLLAARPNLHIVEVPYQFQERTHGASKVVADLGFLRTFLTELVRDRRLLTRGSSRPSVVGEKSESRAEPGRVAP